MTLDLRFNIALARHAPAHEPRYRVAWDDESSEFGFKCRTQQEGWSSVDNPPAVWRFSPGIVNINQKIGDYRVNISAWEQFFKTLNNDTDGRIFRWWKDPETAQFNQTGWPMLAYLVFSGNELRGQRVGEWFKFECLKPGDLDRAQGMTIHTHPHLIHKFTCVTFKNGQTVHIESTGTPRGVIYAPVISREGWGYIPFRNVVEEI